MRFKQSLLEKIVLTWLCLVSVIYGETEPVTVQSLEKMGIEVWENEYEGGKGTYTIFVWPLKVDENIAGLALVSAVTQSAPPMVTLKRLKVHHPWM
jgi:hypothetical protein